VTASIERDKKHGLNFDDDRFVLRTDAGISDLVGVGNNEYRMRSEGQFMRIKRVLDAQGTTSWRITDRNGITLSLGTTQQARESEPGAADHVYKWLLERVEDQNGNFAEYSYSILDDRLSYLSSVRYTGHADLPAYANIAFILEPRPDKWATYEMGFPVATSYRLARIIISVKQHLVHIYELKYNESPISGRSLLSAIKEYGADAKVDGNGVVTSGNARVVRTFTYQHSPTAFNANGFGAGGLRFATWTDWIDANGDGRIDVCQVGDGGSPRQYITCRLNTGATFGPEIRSAPIDSFFSDGRAWINWDYSGKLSYCYLAEVELPKDPKQPEQPMVPKKVRYVAKCMKFDGAKFGDPLEMGNIEDYGGASVRSWVDVNDDGIPDY